MTQFRKPGIEAKFTADGHIDTARIYRTNGSTIQISHERGIRAVTVVRPKAVSAVSLGANAGYVQRPIGPGLVARTYVNAGKISVAVYQPTVYRGLTYYTYVPSFYYAPAFYDWAFNPWATPVAFSWGWQGDPWFLFYGGYFTPARYYPNAALWMTDFLLAQNLMLAYQNQPVQSVGPNSVSVPAELKSMIADEVRRDLAIEQADSARRSIPSQSDNGLPALAPDHRVFIVSSDLHVTVNGGTCTLTPGDTILRDGVRMAEEDRINVIVKSSKPGECPAESKASVGVAALQEMDNQFRRQIDAGLAELARQQGHGGLPTVDAAALAASPGPAGKVRPDSNVESELRQGLNEADKAEAGILRALNGGR